MQRNQSVVPLVPPPLRLGSLPQSLLPPSFLWQLHPLSLLLSSSGFCDLGDASYADMKFSRLTPHASTRGHFPPTSLPLPPDSQYLSVVLLLSEGYQHIMAPNTPRVVTVAMVLEVWGQHSHSLLFETLNAKLKLVSHICSSFTLHSQQMWSTFSIAARPPGGGGKAEPTAHTR